MNYKDQLKSPKWQKKRLEIFNRDEFKCKSCHRTDIELNAHHKLYINGLNAWEYKDNIYVTLCCNCHTQLHLSNSHLNHKFFKFSERCINDYSICTDKYICELLNESLKCRYNTFFDFLFHNDYEKEDIYIYDSFSSPTTQHNFIIVVDEIDFENEVAYISKIEIYS